MLRNICLIFEVIRFFLVDTCASKMVTPVGLEKLGQLVENLIYAKPLHFDGEVIGIMVAIFCDDAGTRASATALQG